jgi:hypothetical protein
MIPIKISDRRMIKVVCIDRDGLPTEEIIREPRGLRIRAMLAGILPHRLARMFGLTPFARMIERRKVLSRAT